jgi:hypothetical protein
MRGTLSRLISSKMFVFLFHPLRSDRFVLFFFIVAWKEADGMKIDGRRIVVDVERGRTSKSWRPRRLGTSSLPIDGDNNNNNNNNNNNKRIS